MTKKQLIKKVIMHFVGLSLKYVNPRSNSLVLPIIIERLIYLEILKLLEGILHEVIERLEIIVSDCLKLDIIAASTNRKSNTCFICHICDFSHMLVKHGGPNGSDDLSAVTSAKPAVFSQKSAMDLNQRLIKTVIELVPDLAGQSGNPRFLGVFSFGFHRHKIVHLRHELVDRCITKIDIWLWHNVMQLFLEFISDLVNLEVFRIPILLGVQVRVFFEIFLKLVALKDYEHIVYFELVK